MRRQLLWGLMVWATPLTAQDWPLGCFARTYDAAHLAAQPDQTVAALSIDFDLTDSPDYPRSAEVRALMADTDRTRAEGSVGLVLENGGACRRYDTVQPWQSHDAQAGLPVCSADCDGGYFEILSAKPDEILIGGGMALLGAEGCGPTSYLGDDIMEGRTVYRLYAASPEACAP